MVTMMAVVDGDCPKSGCSGSIHRDGSTSMCTTCGYVPLPTDVSGRLPVPSRAIMAMSHRGSLRRDLDGSQITPTRLDNGRLAQYSIFS